VSHQSRSPLDIVALALAVVVGFSIAIVHTTERRASSRRSFCAFNLQWLGLAMHNYHASFRQLPTGSGGTEAGSRREPLLGNANRLGPYVGLLPFMNEQELWLQVSSPSDIKRGFPAMGPVRWYDPNLYPPWSQRPSYLACPSDPTADRFQTGSSYVINYGDAIVAVGAPALKRMLPYALDPKTKRGAFERERAIRFQDFVDGISNTLLFAEAKIGGSKVAKNVDTLGVNPSLCEIANTSETTEFWPDGRDSRWVDGSLRSLGFQTILPPNSPSCTSTIGELQGVMSASSYHYGGVHVVFADGSNGFLTDTIDAGDSASPSVATARDQGYLSPGSKSPYGLWGAMGTRGSKEHLRSGFDLLSPPQTDLTDQDLKLIRSGPIQTWTSATGVKTIKAWQAGIVPGQGILLLPRRGNVRLVPFEVLRKADHQRALQFESDLAGDRQTQRDLVSLQLSEQIRYAIKLLEQKNYAEFIENVAEVDPADREDMEKVLRSQRGKFIGELDVAIVTIQKSRMNFLLRESDHRQRVSILGGTEFVVVDGRWKLVVDRLSQRTKVGIDDFLNRLESEPTNQKYRDLVDSIQVAMDLLGNGEFVEFTTKHTDVRVSRHRSYRRRLKTTRGKLIADLEWAMVELNDAKSTAIIEKEKESQEPLQVQREDRKIEFTQLDGDWVLVTGIRPTRTTKNLGKK